MHVIAQIALTSSELISSTECEKTYHILLYTITLLFHDLSCNNTYLL